MIKQIAALCAVLSLLLPSGCQTSAPAEPELNSPGARTTPSPSVTPSGGAADNTNAESGNMPETRVETIILEGMEEEINTRLFRSGQGYSIYFDEERFELAAEETLDRFVPRNADSHPDNFMTVERVISSDPASICETYMEEMETRYNSVEKDTAKTQIGSETVSVLTLSAHDDDMSAVVWFKSDNTGGTYIFTISCTNEAWEGFGSRFIHMLRSFTMND